MRHLPMRDESGNPSLRTFENNGFWYGMSLGGLIGAVAAGPNLHAWPFLASMGTMVAFALGVGLLGYAGVAMFAGAAAGGAGEGSEDVADDNVYDDCRVGGLSADD